jgi:hypothetical protein
MSDGVLRSVAVVAAGILLGACTGSGSAGESTTVNSSTSVVTMSDDDCVAEREAADPVPEEIVEAFGSGPVLGTGGIWTPVPDHDIDSFLLVPEEQNPFLIHLKQPWYRTTEDVLDINLTSPDGVSGGAVELEQESYPPTGFLPSTLSFDTPGCWTVSASYGEDQLSFPLWVPDLSEG